MGDAAAAPVEAFIFDLDGLILDTGVRWSLSTAQAAGRRQSAEKAMR